MFITRSLFRVANTFNRAVSVSHTLISSHLTCTTNSTDPLTHLPQISETRILDVARYLSEDIGYRTVGTYEHALGDRWFYDQVLVFQKECEKMIEAASGGGMGPGGRKLQCEVWRQQGSGSHR